jgi:hypothetical protein
MTAPRRLSIGPRAEEFRQTFGVGGDDGQIHPVDGVGVALAAIQGLHALIQEQSTELRELRAGIETAERTPGRKPATAPHPDAP